MPIWRAAVNLSYSNGGGPGVNVWHFRNEGVGTGAGQVQDLVDGLHTFYASITNGQTTGASCFQAGMTISLDEVVNVEDQTIASVDWDTLTVPAVGPSAPPVLAQVVTWRTSIAARRGRGRTFLGPLAQSAQEANGTPTEEFRAVVQAAADALIAEFSGPDAGAFGVYGRENAGGVGSHVLRDFISASVPNEFAVLRSRRD